MQRLWRDGVQGLRNATPRGRSTGYTAHRRGGPGRAGPAAGRGRRSSRAAGRRRARGAASARRRCPRSLVTQAIEPTEPLGFSRVAQQHLAARLQLGDGLGLGEPAAVVVLDRDRRARRRRSGPAATATRARPAGWRPRQRNCSRGVGAQHAGQQAGLGQHLEAVADAEHRAARIGVRRAPPSSPATAPPARRGAGSRRRRSRRARAPRRRPRRSASACHSAHRLARPSLDGAQRVAVVARPREDDDADPGHAPTSSTSYCSISGFESTFSAISPAIRRTCSGVAAVDLEVEHLARADVRRGVAEPGQRPAHRLALRIEDAVARSHHHGHLHCHSHPLQVVLERLADEPLVGLDVAALRALDDLGRQLAARAASCPSRASPGGRARTACRTTAGGCRARSRRPARTATSPASAPRRPAPARRSGRCRTRSWCRPG